MKGQKYSICLMEEDLFHKAKLGKTLGAVRIEVLLPRHTDIPLTF